ncbi:hypothetical protein K493DRAFT_307376 [Basidiobolus meristosporus CBS 931.73]|uniref:Myb/SANT-like DNA-binding domain-containing protein n=1 Tax=Basidiobolus meristosporus CBS 931.73 TaxID=1314790 RepID=A0A1Y1XGK0_9FUNG|nr:hypothetical protein K493DRAFT_309398 [Basidiobolus meristosporus CBS 931.73]ORX84857.1 hypothetical protein K493DRAFT_307376 [Basidiobolus meristosporus CBS 931.73]|eukprot:ORX66400.1 hypothetical protein K493DRAFT_309398 [Basidiobolus meristosporus CBS 931.73]
MAHIHTALPFDTDGKLLARGEPMEYSAHLPPSPHPDTGLNHNEKFTTPISNRADKFRDSVTTPGSVDHERTSLKRERSENWQHRETQLLIEKWKKYYPRLKKHKRNMSVWEKVAGELQHAGFNRTATMCKSRVRVLMAKYKQCFVNNSEDPEAVANFDYFADMKLLLSGNFAGLEGEDRTGSPSLSMNSLRSYELNRANSNWNKHDRDSDESESDDDFDSEGSKKRKFAEEIQSLLHHLIARDEREARRREATRQYREQTHIDHQKSQEEKERLREEKRCAREAESRKLFEMQSELMSSLIEAIKHK